MTQQMAAILQNTFPYKTVPQTGIRTKNLLWAMLALGSAIALSFVAFLPAQARPQAADAVRTVTNGNLHLDPNEVINEDVFVMSGNVVLEEGAKIEGDLSVMSGNIDLLEGAVIDGDITSFSGNILVAGEVDGDVVALSGNIDLLEGSSVDGDVTVVSGNLNREPNAEVRGDTIKGGRFGEIFSWNDGELEIDIDIDDIDEASARAEGEYESSEDYRGTRRRGRGIGGFIASIFGAIFTTIIMGAIAGGVALVKPSFIQSTQRRMKKELALCFATGLALNLGLLFVSIIAAITVIGLLIAFPIWIVLLLVNLVGSVVAAAAFGERLLQKFDINVSTRYPLQVAVRAATILGPLALLWAMGGCFSFLGFLGFALLNTIGTGAIALPWIRRFMGDDFLNSKAGSASSTAASQESEPFAEETKPSSDAATSDESDDDVDDVDIPITTPVEEVPPQPTADDADDFTKIRGIGAVFAKRLHEAGIMSYAQLAALSAGEVGEIFGWPVERVERDDIIGQARALADL